MAKRSVVILKSVDPGAEVTEGLPPMGTTAEVLDQLARFNTAPDGAKPKNPDQIVTTIYGPGMLVELAAQDDEVRQLMVTMTDEDFAFPVLTRACRVYKWTLMDPETGQRLRFG
ncbi:MAG: hypothetical protein Q8L55_00355 [Phycisphaerales bacterium]|nr:hypothetical protein [Phycisphaerales bacterium]